eukprot:NODE_71_length_23666_cov_0.239403.p5 type:complete len:511 gc:universal NODE_71_length_23666_cov_0.239403:14755-13223(-)
MKHEFSLDAISAKLENIKVRHELMLMEFPELIDMNREFLKRKRLYKESFNIPLENNQIRKEDHGIREYDVSRISRSRKMKSNMTLLRNENSEESVDKKSVSPIRSASPSKTSISPHKHIDKPTSILAPPNKYYNVRLSNYPIFLRRTSVKPSHFANTPRNVVVTGQEKPERIVQIVSPLKKSTANAELQTIEEEPKAYTKESKEYPERQPKMTETVNRANAVIETQTHTNYKTEIIQTSPPWSLSSKSSKTSSNQEFKNLAQRHVVDWVVQQAFIKAMGDPSETSSKNTTTISSSSDSLFEMYCDNILKGALKEYIYEQYIIVQHEMSKRVILPIAKELVVDTSEPSYTMASTDISMLKKSSSSSSKSKKVSFMTDKTPPINNVSIDPVLPSTKNLLDSPISDLSMTETHGEMVPLGSVGEYLELPSFSQMLTNMKIPLDSNNEDNVNTFSSADLNITTSTSVSVGQILVTSSVHESGEDFMRSTSQGEIGINYKPRSPSSFGSSTSNSN